jgi:hypothetical protein
MCTLKSRITFIRYVSIKVILDFSDTYLIKVILDFSETYLDECQQHLRSRLKYVLVNNWNYTEYIPVVLYYSIDNFL